MSFKNWILSKVNGLTTRVDLPRSPVFRAEAVDAPSVARRDPHVNTAGVRGERAPSAPDLGPYAPLIAAIREELEHFAVSYLRLHLTIAERDRYLLTSIDVHATVPGDADDLLDRFIREFKPEQVKHYLAKEVIGALPNASAIDLTQFAGLNAGKGADDADVDDSYSELLAELRSARPAPAMRPYDVSLVGRWSEVGTAVAARAALLSRTPSTPLAFTNAEIEIEDADGSRRLVLRSVVPGRRYAIGKGEGCDIAVNGAYASRRHCELWMEQGTWWLTDAGSTNGVRVERGAKVLGRSMSGKGAGEPAVVEVSAGARVVLSAHAEGAAAEYPRLMLGSGRDASSAATPIAPAKPAPATPSTPIAMPPRREGGATIAARMASGLRTIDLYASALPFSIGRSRGQGLAIDWAHEGVSGHHLDITGIDDTGATVVVRGDNGVSIAGTSYPAGSGLRWKFGDSMALGRVIGDEPECRLTLSPRVAVN